MVKRGPQGQPEPRKLAEVVEGALIVYFDYLPPPEIRGNSRAHWRTISRAANSMKEATRARILFLGEDKLPKFQKARFIYTQYWCGKPLDGDSLLKSVKNVTDTIVDFGVVKDDSPDFVEFFAKAERVPHRYQRGFELRVEDAIQLECNVRRCQCPCHKK